MNDSEKNNSTRDFLPFTLSTPLPGAYFLLHKRYDLALIHAGVFAAVFWAACWAILLFHILFWYAVAGTLIVNWLIAAGIRKTFLSKKKPKSPTSFLIGIPLSLLVLALILWIGGKGILDIRKVLSESMEPVLKEGDYILIDPFAYKNSSPQRNDVVFFKMPPEAGKDSGKPAVKRVAALGGDTIYWRDDNMVVNDTLYEPSSVRIREHEPINQQLQKQVYADYDQDDPYVPENHLFLIGDNYDNSVDSRHFGPVKTDAVHGKVTRKIIPPAHLQSF